MEFEVYGKNTCAKCKSTKDKLAHLLGKAGVTDTIPLTYHDLETVEGMAEGAFNDVHDVPTVILRSAKGEALARWEGCLPPSVEVQAFLGSTPGGAAP